MSVQIQKLIAICAGLVFTLLGVFLLLFGQLFIAWLGDHLQATRDVEGHLIPQGHDQDFYAFLTLAFCMASGLCVTIFLWTSRRGYWRRFIIYVFLLIILLPLFGFNYAHSDYLVNRGAQAVFNILLVFGGSVVVAELMRLRTTSNDLLVLQVLAVFALTFTAVILPATLSVIWLLNALGVIDRSAAKSMGIPTLSTISGVLSATVAYFKIRRETSSA